MNSLVYVDAQLVTAIAAKQVGIELQETRGKTISGSWSFLIQSSVSADESSSIMNDIREYLPEDIIHELYPKIPEDRKFSDVSSAVKYLATRGHGNLVPGNTISICGNLTLQGVKGIEKFDPFQPTDIELSTFKFHGENCFIGVLNGDGFRLPVYFPEPAINQVAFCHDNPVEATGIVRWSPGYNAKGGQSLNLALRVAALWLR